MVRPARQAKTMLGINVRYDKDIAAAIYYDEQEAMSEFLDKSDIGTLTWRR